MEKIIFIAGEFHKKEIELMLKEASEEAAACNLEALGVCWVPGSFEIPISLQKALERSDLDGVVLLGIIERGETKHGLVMGQVVLQSVMNLQLEHKKPVGIGIIGPEVLPEQIEPRLISHARNAVKAVRSILDQEVQEIAV